MTTNYEKIKTEIDFKWVCPNCGTKNTIYDIKNDEIITIIEESILDEACYKCGQYFEDLQQEVNSEN